MSYYYMIISEMILLLSAITAAIITVIKICQSRVSFCRSRCCGNMIDVDEKREIDITPDVPDNTNELNNLTTTI